MKYPNYTHIDLKSWHESFLSAPDFAQAVQITQQRPPPNSMPIPQTSTKMIKLVALEIKLFDSSIWAFASAMLILDHSSEQSESFELPNLSKFWLVVDSTDPR